MPEYDRNISPHKNHITLYDDIKTLVIYVHGNHFLFLFMSHFLYLRICLILFFTSNCSW